MENSHISWTNDTFNPWIGCTKVSPACDGCYAEAMMGASGRYKRAEWGEPGKGAGTRVRTKTWNEPRKWEREQAKLWTDYEAAYDGYEVVNSPLPRYVFCASLADVFDNEVPAEWRRDLFDLIHATPHLTWLLLTKRPGMIVKLFADTLPPAADKRDAALAQAWPRNAAIGATIVNQEEADRDVPKLLAAKGALQPAFAFLSMEPLLGPVDLTRVNTMALKGAEVLNALTGELSGLFGEAAGNTARIDWVITGGETDQGAHKARPQDPDWFRALRDQCAEAGVPFHHKQNGEWCEYGERGLLADGSMNFLGKPDNAPHGWHSFGGTVVTRVGKNKSGRLLDGVEHNARPT